MPTNVHSISRDDPSERAQPVPPVDSRRAGTRGRVVYAVAAAAFVAVIATNLISLGFLHLGIGLLNANWEFSWSHDVDTLALAFGAGVAAVVSGGRDAPDRSFWAATAAILALFCADEVSPLHAEIGAVSFDKLLYAPLLAALAICLWRLAVRGGEGSAVAGGLTTLAVAFGMHVAGLHLLRPLGYTNWIYQTGVGFKQGTELAGVLVVMAALWRLAVRARG